MKTFTLYLIALLLVIAPVPLSLLPELENLAVGGENQKYVLLGIYVMCVMGATLCAWASSLFCKTY